MPSFLSVFADLPAKEEDQHAEMTNATTTGPLSLCQTSTLPARLYSTASESGRGGGNPGGTVELLVILSYIILSPTTDWYDIQIVTILVLVLV